MPDFKEDSKGFRMKGWSPFTKKDNPIVKKVKEYKKWRKKQKSKYNIIEATVPDIPIGPGGVKKAKGLLDTFSQVAKHRKKQSKLIQEMLEKKGYTFGKKKSPLNAIDSRKGPEHVAKQQAIDKKNYKDMKRARRGQK